MATVQITEKTFDSTIQRGIRAIPTLAPTASASAGGE
jgi:hypothetical protein